MRVALSQARTPANWFGNIKININSGTLKDLRISKGFTNGTAFAKLAGIRPSTYFAIENHHYEANVDYKQAIATTLGMTVEEVFPKRESKIKLTIIHESPAEIEASLIARYGSKLMPRKEVTQ